MEYKIKHLLAQRLGIEIGEVSKNGIVTISQSKDDVCNHYGIAHGGYLHTLAHLTTLLAGEICLGGQWELADTSCQYLRALREFPAKTKVKQMAADSTVPVYFAEVYDAKGTLCYTQTAALRPAVSVDGESVVHTPIIKNPSAMPKNLDEEPPFPCYSTSFSRLLNCYSIRREGTGLVYALDLNEINCDETGAVYPAAVFTLADAAAGGSLVRIEKKNPITISATIRFLKNSKKSLVSAIPRLTRGGRKLFYYDVDIVDGAGEQIAFAQFVIQSLDNL